MSSFKKIKENKNFLFYVYLMYVIFIGIISSGNLYFVLPSLIYSALLLFHYKKSQKKQTLLIFTYNLCLLGLIFIFYTNAFILILGIIISVATHELGHLFFMKKNNVEVLEYSIGFGPKLKTLFTKDGIDYNLRTFLLGGFVKPVDDNKKKFKEYLKDESKKSKLIISKSFLQKMLIFGGGVLANFVILISLTIGNLSFNGFNVTVLEQEDINNASRIVKDVRETSDYFVGKQILSKEEFNNTMKDYDLDYIAYGVYKVKIPTKEIPKATFEYLKSNLTLYSKIFTSLSLFKDNATSIVAVGKVVEDEKAKEILDFGQLLNIIGLLNLSLIVFNLLPIPVLDGGHILKEILYHIKRKIKKQKDLLKNRVIFYENYALFEIVFFVVLNMFGIYMILKDTIL